MLRGVGAVDGAGGVVENGVMPGGDHEDVCCEGRFCLYSEGQPEGQPGEGQPGEYPLLYHC